MEQQELHLNGGGTLTLHREGTRVCLQVRRQNDARGLYKVWVSGRGGRMLLGTLAPEGEALGLCRRLSCTELERCGCWPILGGETVLVFPFGRSKEADELVKDRVLRQVMGGQNLTLRRGVNGFLLSAPFDTERPFPLTPLFCLSRVEEGKIIFAFDREGNPVVRHNVGQDGAKSGKNAP